MPDIPAAAQEARVAFEAGWLEANGIPPDEPAQARERKLVEDTWAAALQWAAQLAEKDADRGQMIGLDRIALRAYAIRLQETVRLLREGGGT